MNTRFNQNAKFLFLILFALMVIGLMMVYSSSYIYARDTMGSSWFLIQKQGVFLLLGILSMFSLSQVPFRFFYRNAYLIQWLCTFLLGLVFVKFVGVNIKGSYRWIQVAGFTLQPGELIKYSLLISSLRFFDEYKDYNRDRLILSIASLIIPLIILLFQPDFGTFVICSTIIFFSAFTSDFPKKILAAISGLGFIAIIGLLILAPYRMKRVLIFLDPWSDPKGDGFQIIQSYLAFANGGFTGKGLGASIQKLFYLPEAYNDFLLSVLAEELGFLGVFAVASLFLLFVFFGFRLAMSCKEKLGKRLIVSVIFLIGFQAYLNMLVVLGLLPTKGLNLPFISYGGSSLLANLSALGIVLSFGQYRIFPFIKRKTHES